MDADSFHRLAKALLDSGEALSVDEARASFSEYGVKLVIAPGSLCDEVNRVIAMTTLNVAARTFQGNVFVEGDFAALLDSTRNQSLGEFIAWLGIGDVHPTSKWPTIVVGDASMEVARDAIIPWADGWRFGLGRRVVGARLFAPAAAAAAGLAVNEAFSLLRRDNPYAGRRKIELSLWDPQSPQLTGPDCGWEVPDLWIIGLGHLGQAYAWVLGLMAAKPSCELFLQDVDTTTVSTLSTSILTSPSDVGQKKTRVVARWLQDRGYTPSIVERRFDQNQRVGISEPRIALFGVDNASARRHIEGSGFRLAIDAGLGAGHRDFRGIRVRTFPGPALAANLWADSASSERGPLAAAYQDMLSRGLDACGVAQLASRAVGAPFVGCVAAAYVIAELVKSMMGGPQQGFIDINLREPDKVDGAPADGHLETQ